MICLPVVHDHIAFRFFPCGTMVTLRSDLQHAHAQGQITLAHGAVLQNDLESLEQLVALKADINIPNQVWSPSPAQQV